MKFAIVRNPWDRMISLYFYAKRSSPASSLGPLDFRDWLTRKHEAIGSNLDLISLDGQVAINHVIRFESLIQDAKSFLENVGIDGNSFVADLGRIKAKSSFRPESARVSEFFSGWPDGIQLIKEYAREEIELWGYEFPG